MAFADAAKLIMKLVGEPSTAHGGVIDAGLLRNNIKTFVASLQASPTAPALHAEDLGLKLGASSALLADGRAQPFPIGYLPDVPSHFCKLAFTPDQ